MEERLQKILAQAGLGSRRACEDYLRAGRVRVNGQVARLGQKADPARDRIAVDGELLRAPERLVYVALHKPRGVISSLEPQGARRTVRDLVPLEERLYPVGRLDVDSEGLVLMTNDGALADHLTHPRYEVEKEYRVQVSSLPSLEQLQAWRRGVVLDGRRTAPAEVRVAGRAGTGGWLRVVMHEGRKREIREIARHLGLRVERLIRVRLGPLRLGTLAEGEWRWLEPVEVRALQQAAGLKP